MSIDFQPQIAQKLAYPRSNNNNNNNNNNGHKNSVNSINNSNEHLNSRHYQLSQSIQQIQVPPASSLKFFSKKLLMTSDLANRFLIHVSETEKAQLRIKQRKNTAVASDNDEELQRQFTIVGSEIIGVKKNILATAAGKDGDSPRLYPMNKNMHRLTTPSPAVSTLCLTPHPPSHSSMSNFNDPGSPMLRREKTTVGNSSSIPSVPLELAAAYNESTYLPQIHTAAFFPRRHQFHANGKRTGMVNGIASLKLTSKPCAFCPNNHSALCSAAEILSPASLSPPTAPRAANNNNKQAQQQVVFSTNKPPEMLEQARTLPNIILNFNTGIQPQIVPPPLMPNMKRKPWNYPRTFNPTTSPNHSRLSTAIAIRSISTADVHRVRHGGGEGAQKAHHTAHPYSRGRANINDEEDDSGTMVSQAILNADDNIGGDNVNDGNNNNLKEEGVTIYNNEPQIVTADDMANDSSEKLHVTLVKIG